MSFYFVFLPVVSDFNHCFLIICEIKRFCCWIFDETETENRFLEVYVMCVNRFSVTQLRRVSYSKRDCC